MAKKHEVAQDKSGIVRALPIACADETAAVEFMEAMRWKGEPHCPRCGVVGDCYQMRDRKTGQRNARFLWMCRSCNKQFTVRIGTVLEDSRIPLRHWCYAFWMACSSKKGVSALQIKRHTGLSYKSALFLMHRIRYAMAPAASTPPRPLSGTVEADETYVGGKPRKFPSSYTGPRRKPGPKGDKECVVGMIERGGEVRPVHARRVGGESVRAIVKEHVAKDARLMTDESFIYRGLGSTFEGGHETVMHSVGEYARGEAHTNTIEGFFALLKRGLIGTFHSVSRKHLHRYLAEFQFRYNARAMEDGERTAIAIRKAQFKRLTYREQVRG